MNILVFIVTAFLSHANTCPNLSGHYECSLGSHKFSLQVASQDKLFLMIRDGREMKYEANGSSVSIPDTDSYQNGRYQARCEKNKLKVDFKVELLYEGSVVGRQKSESIFEKVKSDLILTEKTRVNFVPLPTQKFVCKGAT